MFKEVKIDTAGCHHYPIVVKFRMGSPIHMNWAASIGFFHG